MKDFRPAVGVPALRLGVASSGVIPKRYYGGLTIAKLRKIAIMQGIVPLRNLTKRQLECSVYANQCAMRIQRWVRRTVLRKWRARKCIARRLALIPHNREDPILMEPLPPKERVFKFVRPNRQVVGFDALSLVDYINSSGKFEDPVTRIPFHPADLWRLDKQVRDLGYQRHSTLHLMQHPELVKAMREHESLVCGLERIATDVVEMMVEIGGEDGEVVSPDIINIVNMDYLPQWHVYFAHLVILDHHAASVMLDDHRQKVEAAIRACGEWQEGKRRVLQYVLTALSLHRVYPALAS